VVSLSECLMRSARFEHGPIHKIRQDDKTTTRPRQDKINNRTRLDKKHLELRLFSKVPPLVSCILGLGNSERSK
jgi:hypothetical protein